MPHPEGGQLGLHIVPQLLQSLTLSRKRRQQGVWPSNSGSRRSRSRARAGSAAAAARAVAGRGGAARQRRKVFGRGRGRSRELAARVFCGFGHVVEQGDNGPLQGTGPGAGSWQGCVHPSRWPPAVQCSLPCCPLGRPPAHLGPIPVGCTTAGSTATPSCLDQNRLALSCCLFMPRFRQGCPTCIRKTLRRLCRKNWERHWASGTPVAAGEWGRWAAQVTKACRRAARCQQLSQACKRQHGW